MAGNLQLRVRDVCRVCLVLLLWITGMSVHAQSIATRKVSCAFSATRLDEVIRHLTLEAGVSFIYSSNKTDLNKTVTLKVESQPLEETLLLIGLQLGVEFKIQGRYVMIKQHTDARQEQPLTSGRVPFGRSTKTRTKTNVTAFYPASGEPSASRLAIPTFADRLLPSFGPAYTSADVHTIPLPEAREISVNPVHAGWFVSIGPVFNDFSSGIEMQAGIRRAYVVFTPSWMSTGKFHSGYGVGTSIDIARNLSLTPVYSVGNTQHSSTTRWRNAQGLNELKEKQKTFHHMIKLMVQYTVSPSFVVRLGPTINQSYTTHNNFQTTTFTQRRAVITNNGGSVVVAEPANSSDGAALLSEHRVRNAWMGWEAAIAVKLNFVQSR